MKDIKHTRRDFYLVRLVMPKGLGLVGAGGQKIKFLNMVMWHIKLKGMKIAKDTLKNFTLQLNW